MYDAIVIGARCSGAATAMLLARRGQRVLLVDRATFPSDIPHGHLIHSGGPKRLASWGLLDRVTATGCPALTAMTVDVGDVPLSARELVVDGVPVACGPRRTVLDRVLVEAAVEAGAETVVMTRGHRGSIALTRGGEQVEAPGVQVDVVSTLGAGDVFHGALLAALVRGDELADALVFANTCAALSCRALDGRSGIPTLEEALGA